MASNHPSHKASFFEVVPLIGRIVFTAVTRALTYPFRSVHGTAMYNDMLYAAVRCMLDNITIAQSRYLNPSTTERYLEHCRKNNIPPNTLKVTTDQVNVLAHWIGSSDAENVILYFHGGGYTQPANQGNLQYMSRLVHDFNSDKRCRSVSVLLLAYTLAPEATHPTQLREAAAVLSHLINHDGRSPSNIFISGDSAGGNLAFALISHLQRPNPDVEPVNLRQPLCGALLYSPWTGFGTSYASYEKEELDMLSPIALRKWSAMFLDKANAVNPEQDPGPITGDAWTEPCKNPESWWVGLHNIVSDIFVYYGSHEVFTDPIQELERALKKGWAAGSGQPDSVIFFEGPKEAHIAPIVDVMTPGKKGKSKSQVAIEEWLKGRLRV